VVHLVTFSTGVTIVLKLREEAVLILFILYWYSGADNKGATGNATPYPLPTATDSQANQRSACQSYYTYVGRLDTSRWIKAELLDPDEKCFITRLSSQMRSNKSQIQNLNRNFLIRP
jgi:hypothetical protein